MTAHDHPALVPGCARCELSVDEAIAAATATSEPDRLAQIEARLSAATPGPWAVGKRNGAPASTLSILGPERAYDYGADVVVRDHPVIADVWVGNAGNTGAELIAHAPDDLAALVKFACEVRDITRSDLRATLALVKIEALVNDLEQP